jgi:uncharacterized protein (DUF2141 family)
VSELYHSRQNPSVRRRPHHSGGPLVETLENRQLMSLTIDLRLPGGGKSATVTGVGQKINLEVWATVKGANSSTADDGFQMQHGSLLSTNVNGGAANGTFAVTLTSPFNALPSEAGDQVDLDGDGDLDRGSNDNFTGGGHYVTRAASMQMGTSFKIGTAVFTVSSLKSTTGSTNLAYRFMATNGYHQIWREDGQPRNSFANKTFINGSPIVLKRSGSTTTTYSLSGTVFNDTDGDGIKDTGETGRSNVRVYVDKDKDGIFDTGEKSALTNTSGNYTMTGLAAGSTRVRIVGISGYRISTPSAGYHDFNLTGNTSGKNFGVTQRVLITGRAWVDSDKDGIKDSTESILSGWRVYIDKDKDGRYDAGEPTVFTDSGGNYKFTNLAAGSYRVRIVQASGYTRISPTSGYFDKTLGNGATTSNNNFRFTKP